MGRGGKFEESKMKMGTLRDLRIAISGVGPDGEPLVGRTFASAAKKKAGFTGRLFDVDAVKNWLRENANFRIADAYPRDKKKDEESAKKRRQRNQTNPQSSIVGKRNAPSLKHA